LSIRGELYCNKGQKNIIIEDEADEELFRAQMIDLFEARSAAGQRTHYYYRTGADAWLTKRVREALAEMEPSLHPEPLYSSIESSSHGMCDSLDLLAVSRTGRLVVVTVSADVRRSFPTRGLDQWIRIRELNRSGSLQRLDYFPGIRLSEENPRLIFIAPALRQREDNKIMLSYFGAEVDWSFVGISEKWRKEPKVIYRNGMPTKA
jgi:hypothetical protein